jgi:isoprenylcysteine carboxyl methyltransferase (ICMT) family protein YpbQ
MGELAGAALIAHAPLTGGLALAGFGALLLLRIRIEERALGLR